MYQTKQEKIDAYIWQLAKRAGRKPTTELLAMCGKVALERLSTGPNLTQKDRTELMRRVTAYYNPATAVEPSDAEAEAVSDRLFPNRKFNKVN